MWNATRIPSGIPALATYVHALGLRFGLYSDACVCFFFCERRTYDRSPVVGTIHVTLLVGQRTGSEVWVTSGPMRKRSPTGVQIT